MKGDFTRDTFDPKKNFSGVWMQQGRVFLDSDWNEQGNILLHYMRTLAKDLIGPHGGPGDGFKISLAARHETTGGESRMDPLILAGHYYVDGILCQNGGIRNGREISYFNQPFYTPPQELPSLKRFLLYLDVWERHVTCFEDKSLCEVALGGVDTATRTQVVWQVKAHELKQDQADCKKIRFPAASSGLLKARAVRADPSDDACNIEPDARYRGMENQLYRVEIHRGNWMENWGEENENVDETRPTFKWSRDNGSHVFPVIDIDTDTGAGQTTVRLASLGRDDRSTLHEGDMVEIVDDALTLQNSAGDLLRVFDVDRDNMSVILDGGVTRTFTGNTLLRLWNHEVSDNTTGNAVEIVPDEWMMLEDGVEIKFPSAQEPLKNGEAVRRKIPERITYRTGDYWLIPARTATRDVEWERDAENKPVAQPSRRVGHHYAPLAVVVPGAPGAAGPNLKDCRCTFLTTTSCPLPQPATIEHANSPVETEPAESKSAEPKPEKQTKKADKGTA